MNTRSASHSVLSPVPFFGNFTEYPRRLPEWLWMLGRLLALSWGVVLIGLLVQQPELGLLLFWGITIPSLPMVLVVMPGLWRQVCPMAFLNQLPHRFGFSLSKDLPESWRNASFGIAVLLFVGVVSLRHPVLNHHGVLLGGVLLTVLVTAFVGGVVFKGRSGWCGTFCPLGPIQRTYGQAPLWVVPNGYCTTCVGCQKSCYDFNPRAAIFADVNDSDPRHAAQRRLFMGMLPGLMCGYFLQNWSHDVSPLIQLTQFFAACCVSIGVYWVVTSFLPVDPYRVSLMFGAVALGIFYWFTGPSILRNIGVLTGFSPSELTLNAMHGLGLVGGGTLTVSGLISEKHYRKSHKGRGSKSSRGNHSVIKIKAVSGDAAEITDRETGKVISASKDTTLLDAVQTAGLKINHSCRAGMCGADAVAVCSGMENLSPPTETELSTLRRLGLEGKARLACVCKVQGPVVIDRNPDSAAEPQANAVPHQPDEDKGIKAGVSRVVIVGNGVAGMGVAEALRRHSPSVMIDVVTNESTHFYNRMAIGRLIHSANGMDGLQLMPDHWYQKNRVEVHRNTIAALIDRRNKKLHLATGDVLPYDRLVLATGARAREPEPQFLDHANAFVLRTLEDALAVRAYVQANRCHHAVVQGGGVLGVEAAEALHKLGLKVTLLQRADRLMDAQLDEEAAARLTRHLETLGIRVVCGVSVTQFDGEGLLASAWLSHGPRVRADLFVACLGVQANAHLAERAGLKLGKGVVVDEQMRTSDPHIYAVGDVAEAPGGGHGLWPFGAAQANVAAQALLGENVVFEIPRVVLSLKSDGIDLKSFGRVAALPTDEVISSAPGQSTYWRFILHVRQVVGAVFLGPPGSSVHFTRVIQDGIDLTPVLEPLRQGRIECLKDI